MSWTLVETIEKSFPLDEPCSKDRATLIAGMVTGWLAQVVTDMDLTDEQRSNLWHTVLINLGLGASSD